MTREQSTAYRQQQATSVSSAWTGVGSTRWTRRKKGVLAAVVAGAMVVALGVAALAGSFSYTIQWGDTLGDLALEHGTDVETLASLNGIEDPDLIIAGEELEIPSGDEGAGEEALTYTVQDGDTLTSIAEMFGITVDELAAMNGLENVDLIVVGDVLLIPDAATVEETGDATGDGDGDGEEATESDETQDDLDLTGDEAGENSGTDAIPVSATGDGAQLHLVSDGETIEQIAEMYGVTVGQITAANALESGEVAAGMILKIPPAEMEGIVLVGMPAATEQWPLQSELAAASVAASYWGEPIAPSAILEQIEASENPHQGFRGNPQGMWGGTEDYGVYNGALAEALMNLGYSAEAFYSDGDPAMLTSQLDAGIPVVVWITYGLAPQERIVMETDAGRYSLIPEQHAVVAYGYDDAGVWVVDVSDGQYKHFGWDEFLASWSLFDGMSLAVSEG